LVLGAGPKPPTPKSPIPNPQSPIPNEELKKYLNIINNNNLN
jgi:hypothetical protein